MEIDILNRMVMGMVDLSLKRDGRSLWTEDLCSDSTGYYLREYVTWHNPKYGDGSKKDFSKLHAVSTTKGPMAGFDMTFWRDHDSPAFRGARVRPGGIRNRGTRFGV